MIDCWILLLQQVYTTGRILSPKEFIIIFLWRCKKDISVSLPEQVHYILFIPWNCKKLSARHSSELFHNSWDRPIFNSNESREFMSQQFIATLFQITALSTNFRKYPYSLNVSESFSQNIQTKHSVNLWNSHFQYKLVLFILTSMLFCVSPSSSNLSLKN